MNAEQRDLHHKYGVDYQILDRLKRDAQKFARTTSRNLRGFGYREVEATRGEPAYVIDIGDRYLAIVIEGLGTKNIVADQMHKKGAKPRYDLVAWDTVASIVNDITVVGARPVLISAYWAVGDAGWFRDKEKTEGLIKGWHKACEFVGAAWGGGETPSLEGIINPETIDLAGSGIGVVYPKEHLVTGEKIRAGDVILLIPSSGIHINGLSTARSIAQELPEGFFTRISDGRLYGDELLTPARIYFPYIDVLQESGIDIHYMVHISGHGWRKLMRAEQEFTYIIDKIYTPHSYSIFAFIQEKSGMTDRQMYETFNMGAGFAIFLPKAQADRAVSIIWGVGQKTGQFSPALIAGRVEEGPRRLIIEPKNIVFERESLELR